jgi:GT2 family glycosyltransferase
VTGVSFIVTVFDKRPYLPRVIDALAQQVGPFEREFVFVDDGSGDGSAEIIAERTTGWRDPVIILRQPNRGASAATNAGVKRATLPWLKLVDGDDLLVPGATQWLMEAAESTGHALAYGALQHYPFDDPAPLSRAFVRPGVAEEADGLAQFIRNVPYNSSAILVSAQRYWAAGGCDERLVSPDGALFLRLFLAGGAARLDGPVALVPDAAPQRLSGQTRRSRYESVLALYYLVMETPRLEQRYVDLACRRALSRARRFHRAHGGAFFSDHLMRYLLSFARRPADPAREIYQALAAFTEDGSTERPSAWLPGALRQPASER